MPLTRTEAFFDRWEELYLGEFENRPPGVAGEVTSRVAAQVLRLSVLFALGDLSDEVDVRHLEAAMAVWRYCEASAVAIFGTMTGSRDADRVLRALQDGKLSRTEISVLFRRTKSKAQLDVILEAVMATGLARTFREGEGVRARDMYELEPQPKREEVAK
jgi:DNA replicative helicase MCM subunit Mcm2 (Cdc46/Mcm family)